MAFSVNARECFARIASALGLTALIETTARRPCLVVLNYHRISDPTGSPYDPGLFSATAEQFDRQLTALKRAFRIVSLCEALDIVDSGTTEPALLVTFDDGYVDNYTTAFPILKAHSLPATFFLTTGFVGTNQVPWWDAISCMLRRSRKRLITIRYPHEVTVDLAGEFLPALNAILLGYKSRRMQDPKRFFEELAIAADVDIVTAANPPLAMSWANAHEMANGGMDIGAHTHTHPVLSAFTGEPLAEELTRPRTILRDRLGVDASAFAYPVGTPNTFTEETKAAVERAGYRAAFSYYGGVNLPGRIDRYDVRRIAVEMEHSVDLVRLRVGTTIATGTPRLAV